MNIVTTTSQLVTASPRAVLPSPTPTRRSLATAMAAALKEETRSANAYATLVTLAQIVAENATKWVTSPAVATIAERANSIPSPVLSTANAATDLLVSRVTFHARFGEIKSALATATATIHSLLTVLANVILAGPVRLVTFRAPAIFGTVTVITKIVVPTRQLKSATSASATVTSLISASVVVTVLRVEIVKVSAFTAIPLERNVLVSNTGAVLPAISHALEIHKTIRFVVVAVSACGGTSKLALASATRTGTGLIVRVFVTHLTAELKRD